MTYSFALAVALWIVVAAIAIANRKESRDNRFAGRRHKIGAGVNAMILRTFMALCFFRGVCQSALNAANDQPQNQNYRVGDEARPRLR